MVKVEFEKLNFINFKCLELQGVEVNEECILGLRGRQLEGGKCDVLVAVRGCAIVLMVVTFT